MNSFHRLCDGADLREVLQTCVVLSAYRCIWQPLVFSDHPTLHSFHTHGFSSPSPPLHAWFEMELSCSSRSGESASF